MATHAFVGVPYDASHDRERAADFRRRPIPTATYDGLLERYGENVNVRNFDGKPRVSEADALIAYLQMLGTLVDFSTFTPDASR
jgi:cytochrome c oxidase cbb3-type subunit 2